MKFEQGKVYNTLKTLGVVKKPDGRLQLSQRIGQSGGQDVEMSEKLIFAVREDGKLWFTREDGTRICGHPSHFDANHAYNRGETSNATNKLAAAKARVAKTEADLIKATERLAAIEKELGSDAAKVVQAEVSVVKAEDRDEAAALFAE